jgi:molybdopterin converting factor small subunit
MFDGKKIQEDDYSAPLKEGDEVIMFPPVKGG